MSEPQPPKRPFRQTHTREKDGLAVMLLALYEGAALYRVQWLESGRRQENTVVRSEADFLEHYRPGK